MKKGKVLYFANTDWYLYNFRRSLLEKMKGEGWEVVLVSPPGKYGPRLKELGFRWQPFPFSTRSTNPFKELYCIFRLLKLYRDERPDLVHHFTIKCVLYGSVAAFFSRAQAVVNSVTGMGHLFTAQGLKTKVLRPLVRAFYKAVFARKNSRVIFQNQQDLDYFVSAELVPESSATLIRGSGVNAEYFVPSLLPPHEGPIIVLFASRMIKEKGVYELVEAGRVLAVKGVVFELHFAGDLYPENPSSLVQEDIEQFGRLSWIRYHGHVDDIRGLIATCDIVALPSYREGTPRILLEAASMEKPIVATDIAGCQGVVEDGENGFLVDVKNVDQLAGAIEKLILDRKLREQFGKAGRNKIIEEFDEALVIEKTKNVYKEILDS